MLALVSVVLGMPTSSFFLPNAGISPFPGFSVLRYPDFTIVVISGTTTPEQWLIQAVQLLGPPVNYGPYGTIPLWRNSAIAIMNALTVVGVPDDKPVLFVGHSYGGTVASQIAATYHAARPSRVVQLITFGMPRPGDQRLADLLNSFEVVNVQNFADPFPALPPNDFWITIWLGYAGIVGWYYWQQYRHGGQNVELNIDGTTTPVFVTTALLTQMNNLLASVIVIGPPPTFAAHTMASYYDRLSIAPSAMTVFPITPANVLAIKAVY